MRCDLPATETRRADAIRALVRNRAAMECVQPDVTVGDLPEGVEAVVARDGAPTFKLGGEEGGGWWRDCSVPRAASRAMLESLKGESPIACFLHPMHPMAISEALGILGSHQAVIALLEDEGQLPLFLACEDFSEAIHGHRLLFATSEGQLAKILEARPGMPTPGLFIRTNAVDDATCARLIESLQGIIGKEHERRMRRVELLRSASVARQEPPRRLIVSTTSNFRLWGDAPDILMDAALDLADVEVAPWCIDDPFSASPLHLLELSVRTDALLAADFFREGAQGLVPGELAILTWVTGSRVPAFATAGPRDQLLLGQEAFRKEALAQGWPADRLHLAARPSRTSNPHVPCGGHLAMIADVTPIKRPTVVEDFSSHRLLWERVEAEIRHNPMTVGSDVFAYVEATRRSMDIPADTFPAELIVNQLVIPLWQVEVVKRLAVSKIPLRVHGRGWDVVLPELGQSYAGPLASRGELHKAADAAAALIMPYPTTGPLPLETLGRPVISLIKTVPTTIPSIPAVPRVSGSPLSAELIGRLLQGPARVGQG